MLGLLGCLSVAALYCCFAASGPVQLAKQSVQQVGRSFSFVVSCLGFTLCPDCTSRALSLPSIPPATPVSTLFTDESAAIDWHISDVQVPQSAHFLQARVQGEHCLFPRKQFKGQQTCSGGHLQEEPKPQKVVQPQPAPLSLSLWQSLSRTLTQSW